MPRLAVEVVALFGPTGAGKTAVAEVLADTLETEVVSADAMQVYRGLPILTNQPGRPTRLVAIRELSERMSLGEYATLAHTEIDELVDTRGSAVVAGGTGLYLRAALADLHLPPPVATHVRQRWGEEYDEDPEAAFATLRERDPEAAALVHVNDRKRVVRALELTEAGASLVPQEDRLWTSEARRATLVVGLDVPRRTLERRIEERTQAMFRRGVVEEVQKALAASPISHTAAKTLGLHELGTASPAEAEAAIVRRTRRYAAYQRKWMRRIPGIVMIDAEPPPAEVAGEILERLRGLQLP